MPGSEIAMDAYGTDDEIDALLFTFSGRFPDGALPPAEPVAPVFRNSEYLRNLLALVDWVGNGRAVTGTGVLRPALAKQAYDALGLAEWTRARFRRRYEYWMPPAVAAVGLDAWVEREAERPWSRAADCEALHRLWLAAVVLGLLRVSSTKAVAEYDAPEDDPGWVSLGLRAALALMDQILEISFNAAPLMFAMMTSYVEQRRLVTWDEIAAFHRSWWQSANDLRRYGDAAWLQQMDLGTARSALGLMADTGLYQETDEGIRLTDAGDVFVAAWLSYIGVAESA